MLEFKKSYFVNDISFNILQLVKNVKYAIAGFQIFIGFGIGYHGNFKIFMSTYSIMILFYIYFLTLSNSNSFS